MYSVELVSVMSLACKKQMDVILSALNTDDRQSNGMESHAKQQRIPRMASPYHLIRALFILLQNPLNGQPPAPHSCIACSHLNESYDLQWALMRGTLLNLSSIHVLSNAIQGRKAATKAACFWPPHQPQL